MQLTLFSDLDTAFVEFTDVHPSEARSDKVVGSAADGERHGPQTVVLYNENGEAVGVEFINASAGVDLRGCPRPDEIRGVLQASGLSVSPPSKAGAKSGS